MPTLQVAIESRKAEDGSRKFTASLKAMRSASKGVDGSLSRTERRIKRLGKTASGVGGILKRAFAFVGVAVSARRIIGTLATFESNMAELRAVTGATSDTFERFTDRARVLGATTRFTAGQAADGMTFLARTGLDADEVISAIGPSLNLAAAGMIDLGEAADIASNVMAQFSLGAADVEHITDILVHTSNSANTNVRQLAEAMKLVGPVAGAIGITLEETAAAVGALGDAGLQASLAGTNLRGILAALLDPTTKARQVFSELGLDVQKLNPAFSGITGIFDEFSYSAFGAAEAVQIFGRRNAAAALVLTRLNEKTKELAEENVNLSGTAEEQARIMNDTLLGAWRELNSAIDEVILGLGDSGLNGVLRSAVEGLTKFVRGLGPVIDGIQRFFTDIRDALEVSFDNIGGLGTRLFDRLKFGFQFLAFAFKQAILSLAPTFDFIFKTLNDFAGNADTTSASAAEAFLRMSAAVKLTFIELTETVRTSFNEIERIARATVVALTKVLPSMADDITEALAAKSFEISEFFRKAGEFAPGLGFQTLSEDFHRISEVLRDAVKDTGNIQVELDAINQKFKETAEKIDIDAFDDTREANEQLIEDLAKLADASDETAKKIEDSQKRSANAIKDSQDEMSKALVEVAAIPDELEEVTKKTETLTEATATFWRRYKENATSSTAIVNEGLGTGVRALEDFAVAAIREAESVGEAFEKLADAIQDSITRILVRLATTALFEGLASGLGATKTTQSAFRGDSSARIGTSNITATGTTSSAFAQHGGSFLMRGPQSGFAAPLTLHGMERVDVTPLGRERRDSGVVVNIINKSEAKVEERSQKESNGTTSISLVISNAISKDIRNGGGVNRAIRDVFGADVKTGGR